MLSDELKTCLRICLKELRLPTVQACYEQEADRARQEGITYEYYLAEVINWCEEKGKTYTITAAQDNQRYLYIF